MGPLVLLLSSSHRDVQLAAANVKCGLIVGNPENRRVAEAAGVVTALALLSDAGLHCGAAD